MTLVYLILIIIEASALVGVIFTCLVVCLCVCLAACLGLLFQDMGIRSVAKRELAKHDMKSWDDGDVK